MEKKKGVKKRVVLINAFFALFFVFTAGYFFFSLQLLEALTGGVEFSNDVGVGLSGLSTPVDIAAGSSADSIEIGGATLSVIGAPAEQPFLLKTATHKLLQATPSLTSADFSISAMNINLSGYLSAWNVGTTGMINYILGVEDGEDIYFLEKDGSAIEESPQYPTGGQEIAFSATGDGSYSLAGTGGGVVFTEDVILDLAGLETTLYIAEGSSAGYLTVSATTLSVYGVPTSGFFHIKTDNHTVLKIEPTLSTADFTLSSNNVNSLGYLSSWYADSSDNLLFKLGVFTGNMYYYVTKSGLEINGSPFLSNQVGVGNYEISFSSLGVGNYSISASHLKNNAYVRGWAWSDNIGWICFSSQDDPGLGVITYGVGVESGGLLSGYAWSDNIGWISFSEEDLVGCPEGSCSARLESGRLKGWGKVLSNDEWISLSGEISGGGEHGVTLVETDFHGWAWGDKTTGWISFNCANNNECGTVNYKVWLSGIDAVSPTVRTDPATNISPEGTATLNGTLLSMGGSEETVVWFEWGVSPVLGNSTPEMARETKEAIGSFSEEISVVLGETYYFRAVAENAEGLFYGNILRFTVTERTGQIIINFGDFWRGIEISEDGRIEILRE